MEWLNYHHLLYFWVVAREGGLAAAGRVLRLSHPTLSAQVHALEERLGEKLFAKSGRRLVLTETGRVVYRYADEIFSLGREMLDTIRGHPSGQPLRLRVGIVDALSKLVVRRLLQPALEQPLRLVCREDGYDRLLAELALHSLDVVLADSPLPPASHVRAYHHLLGESGLSFFGTKDLAAKARRRFPASLDGLPMLLPLETLSLRRALEPWLQRHGVRPRVIGEFEDSALMKVFGAEGAGIFAAPTVIEREICVQHGVEVIGRSEELKQRFYAISIERRLKHPAVIALSHAARHEMFA